MSAAVDAFPTHELDTGDLSLIAPKARWFLGLRLFLSMVAVGLLCVAALWRVMFPDEQYLADLVAGGAAALVAIPVLSAGWNSVMRPSLHGMTDLLVAIALIAAFVIARGEALFRERPLPIVKFVVRVILSGVLLGLVSAIVSAPVVAYVFGGVTGSGSAFLVAVFLKAGEHLTSAVLHSGFTAEPVDKSLQVLLAALLFRATPKDFIAMVRACPQPALT